jgi:hypothetical protein
MDIFPLARFFQNNFLVLGNLSKFTSTAPLICLNSSAHVNDYNKNNNKNNNNNRQDAAV